MSAPSPNKRFLIVRPDQIGDLTMIIPALQLLREAHPEAHMTLLAQPQTEDLARSIRVINEVWIDPIRSGQATGWRNFSNYVRKVRHAQFDCSIHFLNSAPYARLALAAGIPQRVGYTSIPLIAWMYTDRVNHNTRDITQHEVEQNIELIRGLIGPDRQTEITGRSHLSPSLSARAAMQERLTHAGLPEGEKFAAIHLSAGRGNKPWLPEKIGALAQLIQEKLNLRVVITGGPADIGASETICNANPGVITLAGKTTLAELIATLSLASLYVGADTGPTHLATALNLPIVSLFASKVSEPAHWGPWNSNHQVVRPVTKCTLNCRPAQCPYFYCSEDISVEEVMTAVREIWNRRSDHAVNNDHDQVERVRKTLRILVVDPSREPEQERMHRFAARLQEAGFAVFTKGTESYIQNFLQYGINTVHAMPPISFSLGAACLFAATVVHKPPQLIQGILPEPWDKDFSENYLRFLRQASRSWVGKVKA